MPEVIVRKGEPIDRALKRLKSKLDAIGFYSGGTVKCACCGESILQFLTIDHIKGGGDKHRATIKGLAGVNFYKWLRKQGYPEGYQVLCYNCNCGKGRGEICPHKKQESPIQLN